MRALTLVLVGVIAVTAAAQEPKKHEPAKKPPYERLLKGDDAKKAVELEQSWDKAMVAEDWAEAKKSAQALLELRIAQQGADHYEVTDAWQLLKKVEINAKLTPDERMKLVETLQQNQQLLQLYQQGQFAKATQLGERILAVLKRLLGENYSDYVNSLNNLARLYLEMEEYAKAEPLLVQARDLRKRLLGENHPDYARSLNDLASLYESMGEYAKAEPLLVQARDLYKNVLGENHLFYARSLNNLAALYESMGEHAKAEPLYLQARDLRKRLLAGVHPVLVSP